MCCLNIFWRCIKPLISNKNITKNSDIILTENDNVINKQEDVSNLINDYYVNVTKTIGYEDSICPGNTFDDIDSSHTNNNSVLYIKDNIATDGSKFRFKNDVLLTDLSKAFDCLSYRLIITKLSAYGFDENACMMMANYFTNRQQRVKIGDARSQWLNIQRGATQGSLTGTFIYNILTNDLLYMINDLCEIYNYADDNSICFHGRHVNDIVTNIESVSSVMFTWFKENNLKANPDKYQFILFTKDVLQSTVNINNITLHSLAPVKLLGVHIDRELNFNCHVTEVHVGRQVVS